MAINYNDATVLENHHAAASYKLLTDQDNNFLCNIDPQNQKRFRRQFVNSILSTDMSKHFTELAQFKSKMSLDTFKPTSGSDKEFTCNILFHFSDVSNAAKRWDLCKLWTDLLFYEFFNQGDLEKSRQLQVS
mmetsp:Transcript_38352/g.27805  ORF Transcript_38352/g.27805 Transcript_38352/m.27805 type:complete len:132 (-) Transcript_38352:437-832(-)